eukprot:TRINITY_DN574_c0_g2_i1.p1 TRINITY_DN574_c0_g2~~TRINITY_DN574_c0_g2_i1.p1  ORF type:complete len:696 (-),score=171.03 TRINITY_DN574_c0_g2_i1:1692-3737(-)
MEETRRESSSSTVERTGYKGFGSFHSDNLEELLSAAARHEGTYSAPPLPFEWSEIQANEIPEFGHACRELFLLDPKWTFINHGAFGCAARYPFDFAHRWRIHIERQPLRGLDRELFPQIVNCMRALGNFIEADPRDFVLVNNATTALSSVIRSIGEVLTHQDAIYALDIGYGAVKKLLKSVADSTGAVFKEGRVNLSERLQPRRELGDVVAPLSDEEILLLVEQDLPPNAKLVVFDHVASNSGIVLPIEKLSRLCRRILGEKVIIVIDGAHGPLNLPLSFGRRRKVENNIGNNDDDDNEGGQRSMATFDFYVGNLHKWFSNNKGSAFLWSRRGSRTTRTAATINTLEQCESPLFIHSLNVSHGFAEGFASEFTWSGLQDYSAFLSIPQTIKMWEVIGVERARQYMHQLARNAAEFLRERWNVDRKLPISMEMQSSMALVPLPLLPRHQNLLSVSEDSTEAKYIQDRLHYDFNIEVPIKCIQERLYVRISAHIYNELSDYQKLADAILRIRSDTPSVVSSPFTDQPLTAEEEKKAKAIKVRSLNLKLLEPVFAVCKLKNKEELVPVWVRNAVDKQDQGDDYFITVTRTRDELSVVCPEAELPTSDDATRDLHIERNWRCFKVEGPLDFGLTGIMASLVSPLANCKVSVFPISTFDTDYLLTPATSLPIAINALKDSGHSLCK